MNCGCLYLVATPIGNLDDITYRAVETLKNSDLIACEDTRRSLGLLNHFGIKKPLTSYFEHNKREKGEYIISVLEEGKSVSLITDAGTPAISDPGEELVRQCIEHNIRVIPVPGAAALINALIISGQSTGRFCFEGFLSVNRKSRSEHLGSLKDERRTMIFYEAPHKLKRTLSDMLDFFGDRSVSIIRELTKIHEECVVTTLKAACEFYEENAPKGEYVLVLAGKSGEEADRESAARYASVGVKEHVDALIGAGMDKREAMREVSRLRGLPKREVYNEYEKNNAGGMCCE